MMGQGDDGSCCQAWWPSLASVRTCESRDLASEKCLLITIHVFPMHACVNTHTDRVGGKCEF